MSDTKCFLIVKLNVKWSVFFAKSNKCNKCCVYESHPLYSAVVGWIRDGQDAEHSELVDRFGAWCGEKRIMIVGFKKSKKKSKPICIIGKEVEVL